MPSSPARESIHVPILSSRHEVGAALMAYGPPQMPLPALYAHPTEVKRFGATADITAYSQYCIQHLADVLQEKGIKPEITKGRYQGTIPYITSVEVSGPELDKLLALPGVEHRTAPSAAKLRVESVHTRASSSDLGLAH